jgi:hypothetical protein
MAERARPVLPPPSEWSRLQKLVWTMREHGNEAENLDLQTLARFNPWTSADALLAEFRIQENGARKLPEEISAMTPSPVVQEDEE